MEVLVGTTAQDKDVSAALFLTEETSSGGGERRIGLRRCGRSPAEELSESSSSVGENSENEEEEEEDDDVSSQGRWIDSFSSSLEDSLPIKRGLSNHYIGKSKSFGNLMEASNAKDLEKVESPLNKRRRLLIANKLRRSSLSSFTMINPNSMPLLALQESDDEDRKYNGNNYNVDDYDDDDDSSDDEGSKLQEKRRKMSNNNNRDFMVQTHSCICLTSFQDDDR